MLGVQGGGKSLAARAVAGLWLVPLLRLDVGSLYNKYHGETERNLREALALAERMAPCVLWIDEIEKGLTVDGSDSGISRRLLGTLLTWMAERSAPVFLVATANEIDRLPPELLRKKRFDELFFVDLPDTTTRRAIFELHLGKRGLASDKFDLDTLSRLTEGFSGADIEQANVAGRYTADAEDRRLDTGVLVAEIGATTPLSRVMAEKLAQLRSWARTRRIPGA